MLHLRSSPDICGVVNLITLLVSEDEGSHRHVINVLSDPVHLGHHPVHFADVFTWNGKCYLLVLVCSNLKPAIMTIVQALGTFIPWLPGTSWRPFSVSASSSLNRTCLVCQMCVCIFNFKDLFGSDRSSRSHNVRSSMCPNII